MPVTPESRTPRQIIWETILNQMADLRAEMRRRGLQSVRAHMSTDDGDAGLGDAVFTNGTGSDRSCETIMVGPVPVLARLARGPGGIEDVHLCGWWADECSLQFAAFQVFENVVKFIYTTQGEDAVIDTMDLRIDTESGLEVDIRGEDSARWLQPDITRTGDELMDWIRRETARLSDELNARFEIILQDWVTDLEARWPGLNPDAIAGNGDLFVHVDHPNGHRIRLSEWRFEELEEMWPGLSDEVDRMENLIDEISAIHKCPSSGRVSARRADPIAEPEETPDP